MEPWEVMTSESQERMLAIVTPASWPAVAAICAKWEVRATVIGTVTAPDPAGGGRLRIRDGLDGPVLADVPAASLSDDAPLYDRPRAGPGSPRTAATHRQPPDRLRRRDLLTLLRSARWVYRQYDHQLFLNTVAGPGADAALLRLAGPGLPLGPRRRRHHRLQPSGLRARSAPRHRAVLAEAVANLACVGARRRRGQLPQLRQPRARRGDVAALRVHRRHGRRVPRALASGHRRQRQPLQRERRRRHRPDAGARRARTGRRGPGAPAGDSMGRRRRRRPARRAVPRATAPSPEGDALGHRVRGTTGPRDRLHRRLRPRTAPIVRLRRRAGGREGRRVPRTSSTPCTTSPGAAWRWRGGDGRRRRASAACSRWPAGRPSSSPSCRRASWWRPPAPTTGARAAAAGVAAAVLGRAEATASCSATPWTSVGRRAGGVRGEPDQGIGRLVTAQACARMVGA